MSGQQDYYQILGASRGATREELARAYRQQSVRCHPDRGGSHEAMCRLNEAWQVLQDPESRRAYDEFLAQQGTPSTTLSTAVERARGNAGQYPRAWADFERWMNGFLNDFSKAEYGWASRGPYIFPTAKNSTSGSLFIFVGCLVGFMVGGTIWMTFKGTPYYTVGRLIVFIGIALGGSLGMLIHWVIGSGINAARRSSTQAMPSPPPAAGGCASPPPIPGSAPEQNKHIKLNCPHCGQHIEAPADLIGTVVSCPTCNGQFHVGKRANPTGPAPQPPPIPGTPRQPPPIPDQPKQPPPIP